MYRHGRLLAQLAALRLGADTTPRLVFRSLLKGVGTTVVSVGHRDSLAAFHSRLLRLGALVASANAGDHCPVVPGIRPAATLASSVWFIYVCFCCVQVSRRSPGGF